MKARLLLAALLIALSTAGCVDGGAFEEFTKLDVRREVLASDGLLKLMSEGARPGRTLAGAALVVLCLILGFRAHQGQAWLGLAKECFIGGIVAVFLLTTYAADSGPVRSLADLGWTLYNSTTAGRSLHEVLGPLLATDAAWMRDAHGLVEGMEDLILRQQLQIFLFQWSQPFFTALFGVNVLWIFVLRYILLATYSFLIAFYWVLTPYLAWTAVLPMTRPVFKGFVQSYVAVCLWPLLLGITERLIGELPWNAWFPPLSPDPSRAMSQWSQHQLVLFSMNAVFLSAIASIPIIASRTVSGAVRSAIK